MSDTQIIPLILANEGMAIATLVIVFPGFLPPRGRMEWVMFVMMMIPMSFVWWIFLGMFPFMYFLLWWAGELKRFNPHFHEWPFKQE